MAIAPTILIGLGGIGCQVVDRVFGRLPKDAQAQVLIHGFDTNINDISELTHLGRNRVTQTSQNWTVGQYLNASDNSVKDWFPDDSPELLRKTLTDGAGQIRTVSRLAYRAALDAGVLNELEQQINALFRANAQALNSSVRIMIVNSIVGGTGAGLFLQIALFLRQMLQEKHGRASVLVRGAFLLPDVLINTKTIDQNEYDNVRANAYACLKELDAITLSARGSNNDQGTVTIELEFRPNQTDNLGRRDFSIPHLMLPYDFSFLFDFENAGRYNLGSLKNYINQVVDSTFVQLFSPITGDLFSVEDNKILNLIEAEGRSRYAGCGVASLTYPYDDIIAYCALSWADETLSGQWLNLDERYDEELRIYENDLRKGITREKPVIAKRYTWLLENSAQSEKPDVFFRQIYRQAYLEGEKGQIGDSKALGFLAAIDREINRIIGSDRTIIDQQGRCKVNEGLIKIRERAVTEITRTEDELEVLRQQVFRFIPESRTSIVNQVLTQDCEIEGHIQGEECRLNTWILNKPEPLHPVAIRYTLYSLILLLDKRIADISPKNQQSLKGIERYPKSYDLVETVDEEETAYDRIRKALRQPMISRLLNNHFDQFIDEYTSKSSKQLNLLTSYLNDSLKEAVYREIREKIAEMVEDWEHYFSNLRHIRNELLAEKLTREIEHEQAGDPTRLFVLASRQSKQALWEELRPRLVHNNLSADISREIYLGQYKRHCARCRSDRDQSLHEGKIGELFRHHVLNWCDQQLRQQDRLDMNIISALRNEAGHLNFDSHKYVLDRIGDLNQLAQPLIQGIPGAQKIDCWGLHNDAHNALTEQNQEQLFGSHANICESFSRYQILRYTSIYGLKAEDLGKFSAGNEDKGIPAGVYYLAYKKRIQQLLEYGNTVTPHLDKRWHLPAYMPDLNSTLWIMERNKIQRALFLGLIYGYIKASIDDGKSYWFYYGMEGSQSIKRDGKRVESKTYLIHQALSHNPALVDKILQRAKHQELVDRQSYPDDLTQHLFWKLSLERDILEQVFNYPVGNSTDASLRVQANNELLPALIDETSRYCSQALGSHRENNARKSAARLLAALRDQSTSYNKADKQSMDFQSWKTRLDSALAELTNA